MAWKRGTQNNQAGAIRMGAREGVSRAVVARARRHRSAAHPRDRAMRGGLAAPRARRTRTGRDAAPLLPAEFASALDGGLIYLHAHEHPGTVLAAAPNAAGHGLHRFARGAANELQGVHAPRTSAGRCTTASARWRTTRARPPSVILPCARSRARRRLSRASCMRFARASSPRLIRVAAPRSRSGCRRTRPVLGARAPCRRVHRHAERSLRRDRAHRLARGGRQRAPASGVGPAAAAAAAHRASGNDRDRRAGHRRRARGRIDARERRRRRRRRRRKWAWHHGGDRRARGIAAPGRLPRARHLGHRGVVEPDIAFPARAFALVRHASRAAAPPPPGVVDVYTSDGEWFPVKRRLLRRHQTH